MSGLSTNQPNTLIQARAFRRPPDLPESPTDVALLRAVQMYLCGEPEHLVARLLGVNPSEVRELTTRKGWRFIEDCVREDVRSIALSNLTRLEHKCFRLLDQRLDQGDPLYDQNGDVVGYRAVKAKDLANMAVQFIDKAELISHRTAKPEEDVDLHKLAKSLENYANEKRFRGAQTVDPA